MSKRLESEAKQADDDLKAKDRDLKMCVQEIHSYNRQLQEVEKGGPSQAQALQNANNALKSTIHQKLQVRERERYEL